MVPSSNLGGLIEDGTDEAQKSMISRVSAGSFILNCSGSVVRPIISDFRSEDTGSNPVRSINLFNKMIWRLM